MKKMGSLLGCILWGGIAFSQFNDSTHYHVNYAATGTINKAPEGNSYVLNNGFAFEVSKKAFSLNTTNSCVYGESDHHVTNNDFSSALNFDLYRAIRTWYYWGLASYTSSYSLNIN